MTRLELFVVFVRLNPHIPADDPVIARAFDAYAAADLDPDPGGAS